MLGKSWDAGRPAARRELKLHASELDRGFALHTPPHAAQPVRPEPCSPQPEPGLGLKQSCIACVPGVLFSHDTCMDGSRHPRVVQQHCGCFGLGVESA